MALELSPALVLKVTSASCHFLSLTLQDTIAYK